jgi:hypothetical protein
MSGRIHSTDYPIHLLVDVIGDRIPFGEWREQRFLVEFSRL